MKNNRNSIGFRMKGYESVSNHILVPKMPVIIRLDGIAFHTFTRGFVRPFDDILIKSMQETMKELCSRIPGCVLGYAQSDEITLVLVDYKNRNTECWHRGRVQKIASTSASIASVAFNNYFYKNIENYISPVKMKMECDMGLDENDEAMWKQYDIYRRAFSKGAIFDSRCFNAPVHEVVNALIFRQQDAERNSVQMLAQSKFSHNELMNLNTNQLQEKLFSECGINWNNLEPWKKRGSCCIKVPRVKEINLQHLDKKRWPVGTDENGILHKEIMDWEIIYDIPIFSRDKNFVETLI